MRLAALAIVAPACAQERPAHRPPAQAPTAAQPQTVSGEIVVTAQKREQRLIDVPQSVSVIPPTHCRHVHAERLDDYFTRVPSANDRSKAQAGQARIVLRGINTGGVGATVATYVDETPYGSATRLANGAQSWRPTSTRSISQRIEVLRGPQGTLYGANSLGGLVKYVTVAPRPDARPCGAARSRRSKTPATAHRLVGTRGASTCPSADELAIRVSGYLPHDPGFIDDPRHGAQGQ